MQQTASKQASARLKIKISFFLKKAFSNPGEFVLQNALKNYTTLAPWKSNIKKRGAVHM